MKIKTNHHWHNLLYGYEVPAAVLAERDDADAIDCDFVKYKGIYYCIEDFMSTIGSAFEDDWHGYAYHHAFAGVLIRLSEDGEQYQIATYTC